MCNMCKINDYIALSDLRPYFVKGLVEPKSKLLFCFILNPDLAVLRLQCSSAFTKRAGN